jgi:hypothetical protein
MKTATKTPAPAAKQPAPKQTINPAPRPAPAPAPVVEEKALVPVVDESTEVGFAIDFAADAGMGNEEMSATDLAIPYLSILQKNSPQVDKDSPKYVPGAEVGMIFNTATNELYDGKATGVEVVPCYFTRKFVEWTPREQGGGFVASYDPNAPEVLEAIRENLRNDKGKLINRVGNLMTETAYNYVLLIVNGNVTWAIISMASTQHKASRAWNSIINGIKLTINGKQISPARFSHVYRLTTKLATRDTYTWYGWVPALVERVSNADLYNAAKGFAKAVADGIVNVGAPPQEEEHVDNQTTDRPF